MNSDQDCIFCFHKAKLYRPSQYIDVVCPNCGNYRITTEAFEDLPNELNKKPFKKTHISGYLRELTELGLTSEPISNQNVDVILASANIPKSVTEKLDKLILFIFRKTSYIYEVIEVDTAITAIGYAASERELQNMFKALCDEGYLSPPTTLDSREYSLTLKGFERARSLTTENIISSKCFVAMWFGEEMIEVYDNYISKAVSACGFDPLIISQKEHNDKICDQIISEIRSSKFVIADFTAHRGGVYFEAGFAYGLGRPVIWTCRKDHLKDAHFDVNHYNFIVWENGEDLYQKMVNRIKATIL